MTSDERSPRQGAPSDASQSIGRITYLIEQSRHVVGRLVMEEQASGRQAHQRMEAEASEMRQYNFVVGATT
eukprot:12933315-Prorocentrum_lima.AAC.1